MASLPKHNLTVEEYFALDDASPVKLEYYHGEVYAMAGALRVHNLIASNATSEMGQRLRDSPCEVYQSDQRVQTGDGLFTYPDISISCVPKFLEPSGRTLLNPVLIVEVLSDSTEIYDRTNKFESYQTIESLQQYLLISSNRMHVDLYTRDGTEWRLSSASRPEDVVELASCGCRLQLSDLYRKVQLPERPKFFRIAAQPDGEL